MRDDHTTKVAQTRIMPATVHKASETDPSSHVSHLHRTVSSFCQLPMDYHTSRANTQNLSRSLEHIEPPTSETVPRLSPPVNSGETHMEREKRFPPDAWNAGRLEANAIIGNHERDSCLNPGP